MAVETKNNNKFSFSFKKNNIDEMFYNLTENPVGCDKKDFRLMMSTIYQLVEDEFGITFQNSSLPIKNTNFYLLKEGKDFQVFVTPTNNFDFYLTSRIKIVSAKIIAFIFIYFFLILTVSIMRFREYNLRKRNISNNKSKVIDLHF